MGWFGYAWHPVGVEAFLAGEYDQSTPERHVHRRTRRCRTRSLSASRASSSSASSGPAGWAPSARASRFRRKRLRVQPRGRLRDLRQRHAPRAPDARRTPAVGRLHRLEHAHLRLAGALGRSLRLASRVTPTLALALGGSYGSRTAGSQSRLQPGWRARARGRRHRAGPLPTPAYHFASGAQTFIGPYMGLQFGP